MKIQGIKDVSHRGYGIFINDVEDEGERYIDYFYLLLSNTSGVSSNYRLHPYKTEKEKQKLIEQIIIQAQVEIDLEINRRSI